MNFVGLTSVDKYADFQGLCCRIGGERFAFYQDGQRIYETCFEECSGLELPPIPPLFPDATDAERRELQVLEKKRDALEKKRDRNIAFLKDYELSIPPVKMMLKPNEVLLLVDQAQSGVLRLNIDCGANTFAPEKLIVCQIKWGIGCAL